MLFFKGSAVSYVLIFLYADYGGNIQRILAQTVFTQIENLYVERVRPGEKVYFAHFAERKKNRRRPVIS